MENLKKKAKELPSAPGIYKFLDKDKNIIYIGKSKNLKQRVSSYFHKKHKWEKVNKMVHLINSIEHEVCDTHLEARLLECQLIKSIKPWFNSQYKNDRGYVYVKIGDNYRYKPFSIVSSRVDDSFGPFRRRYSLNETMERMRHIFPICDNYQFSYNILPIDMDKDTFDRNRQTLLKIFGSAKEMEKLILAITNKMQFYSNDMQYEIAANLRNLKDGLSIINKVLYSHEDILSKDIILKIPINSGYKLFYVKSGLVVNCGNNKDLNDFLADSKDKKTEFYDEKSRMDFRDILLSELNTLSEECIIYV
jgi:excinuclease ABC subunit C